MSMLSYARVAAATFFTFASVACQANEVDEGVGQASLELQSTSTSGKVYRLSNAHFSFSDRADPMAMPVEAAGSDAEPVLDVDLPVGGYAARLEDGWVLQRGGVDSDADGVPDFADVPVSDRILTSANPVDVDVLEQQVSRVTFAFKVGDDIIQFGHGRVEVAIEVDDGAFSCPAGQTSCAGVCVDTLSDEANCGACGSTCLSNTSCLMGSCAWLPYEPRGECWGGEGHYGSTGASQGQCQTECDLEAGCQGYSWNASGAGSTGTFNCWLIHSCAMNGDHDTNWSTYCHDASVCFNEP
jgi:hypothetical protein